MSDIKEVYAATKANSPYSVRSTDVEKGAMEKPTSPREIPSIGSGTEHFDAEKGISGKLRRWNNKIESLAGLEARGITRVMPDERHQETLMGFFQMAFLWFSANITANNLAVTFLGPLLFDLGFTDAVVISVFGAMVGSLMTAYMSIWGSQSGSRTMVSNYTSFVQLNSCNDPKHRLLPATSWAIGRPSFALF
jgi:hypothetical protein